MSLNWIAYFKSCRLVAIGWASCLFYLFRLIAYLKLEPCQDAFASTKGMTAIRYDANKQGININYRIRPSVKYFWLIASQIILARSPNNKVFGSLPSMKSHSQFIFTDG